MPAFAETQLCNEALSRVGCLPVASLDEPYGPQGQIPRDVFNSVLRTLLGMHHWTFTNRFMALTRYGAGKAGWSSAFVLPPGRIDMPTAYYESNDDRRPIRFFELYEGRVHTSSTTCYAQCRVAPIFEQFPSYFTELMQLVLMSEFAMAIREDKALRRSLREEAYGNPQYQGQGGQFAVAVQLDAHGAPQQAAPTGGRELHILRGPTAGQIMHGNYMLDDDGD